MTLRRYALAELRKALAGGLVTAVALLAPDLSNGALSRGEAGGLVAAFVSGAVAVFVVPNRIQKPAAATRPADPDSELC